MVTVNLLELLNNIETLAALEYSNCRGELVDFLDLVSEDEQFTRHIDMGVVYIRNKSGNNYVLIDGLNRFLSLSLLLHAICECYKKTSQKNDKAIRTIRSKYLLKGTRTKLRLNGSDQEIYEKIIYGERLSGHEKSHPMFVLLHRFWTKIKNDKLQAGNIFKMLEKLRVIAIETDSISDRDLYYNLNKDRKDLKQFALIESYLKDLKIVYEWKSLLEIYDERHADLELFFKDFFITKFNFKVFDMNRLYVLFINYFETMRQYKQPKAIFAEIIKSAELYNDILNINFQDKEIKNGFIKIKMNGGEDTYAYLLNIYEDYIEGNISKGTFVEILDAINEYLQNRVNAPNDIGFNDLIQYLNAFITCK